MALTVSSYVIATLGLPSNSAAVILGAMIIAPFLLPAAMPRQNQKILVVLPKLQFL
ncbi:hypothetical protein [Scytonema millei]|uniref:hypothetical protein n=1 Tax=Scytonema millei TaxID=1245922 RepID=UPI002573F7A2|nr:hypothetical protein [Scytonema millei]